MKHHDHTSDDELHPHEASALASLKQPASGSESVREAVMQRLARRGAFRRTIPRAVQWAAVAAGFVFAFLAGMRVGAPPTDTGPAWAMLLLNEPATRWPAGMTGPQIVQEFRDWAAPLQKSARLLLAEELRDVRYLVDSAGVRAPRDASGLNGLFIVRAADSAAAVSLVRTNPHVRHGGAVVLQAIVSSR